MSKSLPIGLVLVVIVLGVALIVRVNRSPSAVAEPAIQPGPPETKKQLWTCGMHPQVVQDHPGTCPICHMKLTAHAADGRHRLGTRRLARGHHRSCRRPEHGDSHGQSSTAGPNTEPHL